MEIKNKTKEELIELVKHYKKLAEIKFNQAELNKEVLTELQKENISEIDKDFQDGINKICKSIINEKIDKPKSWYQFPKRKLNEIDIAKWYEATENYYHFAKRYESQERGHCCSVDRAYRVWLIPKCKVLLKKIKELGVK